MNLVFVCKRVVHLHDNLESGLFAMHITMLHS
jgi:hypothetical protein